MNLVQILTFRKADSPLGSLVGEEAIYDVKRKKTKRRIRRQINSSFQEKGLERGTFAGT